MFALMLFAVAVSVVQLAGLGSWTRSVRVTTLLQAIVLGTLVCGPVTAGVEWVLTRAEAAWSSRRLADVVTHAAWTYDPVVEELVKIAPLLVVAWAWPRIHRQLGWTDHLLLGYAAGAGFALCEAVLRYGTLGSFVRPTTGGYIVQSRLGSDTVVPSVGSSVSAFLPPPVHDVGWFGTGSGVVGHAVWTGVAALGVAWAFRRRGWARLTGLVPVVLACLSHAAWNAYALSSPFAGTVAARFGAWVLDAARGHMLLILVALVVADRVVLARAARLRPDLALPGETRNLLNPLPLWRAAIAAPPWSVLGSWYVALQRRAALYGLGASLPLETADRAAQAARQLADASDKGRWRQAVRKLGPPNWRVLTSWRVLVWLGAMLPGLAYLVAGGFPGTRRLQAAMAGPAGTGLLLTGLTAGIVLACLQAPGLVRSLRGLPQGAWHEAWLRPSTTLAIGGTSALAGVVLAVRLFASGSGKGAILTDHHMLDALSSAMIVLGLAMMILALFAGPPGLAALGILAGEGALTVAAGVAAEELLSAGLAVTAAGSLLTLATAAGTPGEERTSRSDTDGEQDSPGSETGGNPMLGEEQPRIPSESKGEGMTAQSDTYFRVDIENPNPGQRPGQIHVHVGSPKGPKFMYDPETGTFQGDMPRGLQKELLSDSQVVRALNRALRWFNLPPR